MVTVVVVGVLVAGPVVGLLAGGVVWVVGGRVVGGTVVGGTVIGRQPPAEHREAGWRELTPEGARHLPTVEAIELLALATSGSTGLPLACRLVADTCGGATADTFRYTAARLSIGDEAAEAFPPPLADVSTLIDVSRRWGAPIAEAMRYLASDLRDRAASAAEEAAEGLAVRLVFPTTLLLVPAFGLVVVVPLAVSMLAGLSFGP